MYLEPQWRVLTVGDGDLSFSRALHEHHQASPLVASCLDDEQSLIEKYGDAHLIALREAGVKVQLELDITKPDSVRSVPEREFDVVIFQFPLIPNAGTRENYQQQEAQGDSNLRHRCLLWTFLRNAADYWLDPVGAGLAMITSKAVKPYDHWGLEGAICRFTGMHFHGTQPFMPEQFPGYQIRNVDRDKTVKDTAALTYVYSNNDFSPQGMELDVPDRCREGHCRVCGKGPFSSEDELRQHQLSVRHGKLAEYDSAWQSWLETNIQTSI